MTDTPKPSQAPRMAIRDDSSWLVKNLDTGEERYVTNHDDFGRPVNPQVLKKRAWGSWWQQQRSREQRLLAACQASDAASCHELLAPYASPAVRANALHPLGHRALHVACASGGLEAMRALLHARAEVESISSFNGLTPLHVSAVHGHAGTAQVLLAARADAQRASEDGHLPLDLATGTAALELLRCTPQDGYGRTAGVTGVRRNGRSDHVRRLLMWREPSYTEPTDRPRSTQSVVSRSSRSSSFLRLRDVDREELGPDSFEPLLRLGRGAFGEVFHVRQKATGKSYAMKVLQKEKIVGNLLRYAFTERNILSYIQHPYIVSLHCAFQTQNHLVLVMQFCPGGSLHQLIRRLGRRLESFPSALAQLYTGELLLALQHLHERNVVYRDLKPDNVVLDEQGHGMLTDFGLSKDGVTRLQGTRTHCGSVAYIAPEILLGQKYGPMVDIYNLGVLLYNMLVGLPPFFHHEKETLQKNIMHAALELPGGLPKHAQSFISATMTREPLKRLGAKHPTELRGHAYFGDLDFELLQKREVPLPVKLPRADVEKPSKSGLSLKGSRCSGVPHWDYEAPEAKVDRCRVPRRRFRICGLRW